MNKTLNDEVSMTAYKQEEVRLELALAKHRSMNEFVYRYNLRNELVFPALIAQAAKPALIVGESHV